MMLRRTHVFRRALSSTPTATSLLEDSAIAAVLKVHKLKANDPVGDADVLVHLLSAFRTLCNKPMTSNAFLQMRTAYDIAEYYERALAPADVHAHAKRMLDNRVSTEGLAALARTEANADAVRQRATEDLPSNLKLDPSTFDARPTGVMATGKRLDNVPFVTRKILKEARRRKLQERSKRIRAERERLDSLAN